MTQQSFDERAGTWDDDPAKVARAEAVAAAMRDRLPPATGRRGFEFGCGTGLLSFALRDSFAGITLADTSDGMLAVLAEKIGRHGAAHMRPLKLDLGTDPLPDERYDVVYTLMTVHHVPDTDRLLRAFHALLDSPGYLCIADLDSEDGSFHGAGFDGHNGFDRAALAARAEAAGFRNVGFTTVFRVEKGGREYPAFLMIAEKA